MQLEVQDVFFGPDHVALLTPMFFVYVKKDKASSEIQQGETITLQGSHVLTGQGRRVDVIKPY
jgi:hypothetical protein